jgi:peptide/nickel transport system permease protein
MRSSLLNVLTEDYITIARAKGLDERTVLFKHALKNAILPVITVVALRFGAIFSGAIIAETVFSWNGVGKYLWEAIQFSDYPVLQAVFFVVALATILANFSADVLYGFLDPRITH